MTSGFDVDFVFFNQIHVLSARTWNWRNHCETSWNGRQHGVAYGYWSILRIYDFDRDEHPAILDFDVKTKEAPGYWSIPVRSGHVSGHGRLRLGMMFTSFARVPGQTWFGNARLNLISTSKGSRERSLRNCRRECRKKLIISVWQGGVLGDTPFLQTGCISKYLQVSPSISKYLSILVWPPGRDFTPQLEHIMLRNFPRNLMATVAALLLSQTEAGSTTRPWGSICQDPNFEICHWVTMPFHPFHCLDAIWKSPLAKWRDVGHWQVKLGLLWLIKPHVRLLERHVLSFSDLDTLEQCDCQTVAGNHGGPWLYRFYTLGICRLWLRLC